MKRESRKQPLYQRYRASGVLDRQLAGVEAALKAGDDPTGEEVTWLVSAETVGDLAPAGPVAGTDYMRDTAGRWWEVVEVAPLADGVYACRCVRWKDGGK